MIRTIIDVARLTQDPQMKSKGDLQICEMRVADQRRRGQDGQDRGAVFVTVTAFGKQAVACGKYLHKGSRISVPDARLEQGEWKADDGSRRERHTIIASRVTFLDPPPALADEPSAEATEPSAEAQPEAVAA